MKKALTPQTSSMGTHKHLQLKGKKNHLESSTELSFEGAATVYIIYQIIDINVNIYDISLYLKFHFKEKEKNQKKKNIYRVNKYYKCIISVLNIILNIIYIIYIY